MSWRKRWGEKRVCLIWAWRRGGSSGGTLACRGEADVCGHVGHGNPLPTQREVRSGAVRDAGLISSKRLGDAGLHQRGLQFGERPLAGRGPTTGAWRASQRVAWGRRKRAVIVASDGAGGPQATSRPPVRLRTLQHVGTQAAQHPVEVALTGEGTTRVSAHAVTSCRGTSTSSSPPRPPLRPLRGTPRRSCPSWGSHPRP
jgi:hypothetical protein